MCAAAYAVLLGFLSKLMQSFRRVFAVCAMCVVCVSALSVDAEPMQMFFASEGFRQLMVDPSSDTEYEGTFNL